MVDYAAPQISDRAVPFRSWLIIRGRSEELEALAVEMYARALSPLEQVGGADRARCASGKRRSAKNIPPGPLSGGLQAARAPAPFDGTRGNHTVLW
jgi:hypothetical protein